MNEQQRESLEAMTQADKYKAFRNYMTNELGIGREDIKAWVIEAVRYETAKIVGQLNIASLAESTTRYIVSGQTTRGDIEKQVQAEIAKMISKQYRISVTPKEES